MIRGKWSVTVIECIVFITSFLTFETAPAASVQVAKQLSVMATENRQVAQSYGPSNSALISGFNPTDTRKFLMIGMGPESISAAYQSAVSYTGIYPDDLCRLENTPAELALRSLENRTKDYKKKVQFAERCLQLAVRDVGSSVLRLPPQQVNCSVISLDPNTALVNGGYCFFGIGPGSAFQVEFRMRPECASSSFLELQEVTPQDLFVGAGFFIAGDASGHSLDLDIIDVTRVRMTIEPSGKIFPISLYSANSSPLWPTRIVSDIHMGNLRVLPPPPGSTDNAAVIDSSLFVRNTCPTRCEAGRCESECDYTTALGAEMRLFHLLPDGRSRLLETWYGGGVAPAQWEGMLPSSHKLNYAILKNGERYRLTANLDYPGTYYQFLTGGFKQNLIDLKGFTNAALASGGTLPTLGGLSGMGGRMPSLPTTTGLPTTFDGRPLLGNPFQDALTVLQNMFKIADWPPYYEEFCSREGQCKSLRSASARSEVGIDFDMTGQNGNGVAVLSNLALWRKSEVMPNYNQPLSAPPEIRCGW